MRKLPYIILILLVCSVTFAQSAPPLEITETDGSPSTYPYKLKFPNGIVIDNADATTTILGYTTAPTNPDDSCSLGQWSVDTTYYYACVGTDTWKRVEIATWIAVDEFLLLESGDFILLETNDKIILE